MHYGETLNDMLRDRKVCGVRDEHIQRCLLAEGNLTLQKALDIAQSMERAVENAATLRGKDSHQATADIVEYARPSLHKLYNL